MHWQLGESDMAERAGVVPRSHSHPSRSSHPPDQPGGCPYTSESAQRERGQDNRVEPSVASVGADWEARREPNIQRDGPPTSGELLNTSAVLPHRIPTRVLRPSTQVLAPRPLASLTVC